MKRKTISEGVNKLLERNAKSYAKTLIRMIDLWQMLGSAYHYAFTTKRAAARTGKTESMVRKLIEEGMDTGIISYNSMASEYSFNVTAAMMRKELEALNAEV